MFVTNLTKHHLGVDGVINLKAKEANRYIEETDDLVQRVKRLEKVKLVTVSYEEGLVKDGLDVAVAPVEPKPVAKTKPVVENTTEPTDEEVPAKPKRGGRGAK